MQTRKFTITKFWSGSLYPPIIWYRDTSPRPIPTTWSHGSTKYKNHSHQNQFYGFVFYNLVMTDDLDCWQLMTFLVVHHHQPPSSRWSPLSLYLYFSWTHPLGLSFFDLWWCEGLGCLMVQNMFELWLIIFW